MRKLFAIILTAAFVFAGSYAMADCYGPDCFGSGDFSIDTYAGDSAFDYDSIWSRFGYASGYSEGEGFSQGWADGYVYNGDASGMLMSRGGGLAGSNAYTFDPGLGDLSKGIGSSSFARGETAGSIDLTATGPGFGHATGWFYGSASEYTGDYSNGWTPNWFVADGYSYGSAGQSASGSIDGWADVYAHGQTGDYEWVDQSETCEDDRCPAGYYRKDKNPQSPQYGRIQYFRNGHPVHSSEWTYVGQRPVWVFTDATAAAGASAGINMFGSSYSETYGFVYEEDGMRAEGLGTNVGANTHVRSYGDRYADSDGYAYASSGYYGSWRASGGAYSMTDMYTDNGFASASAFGSYYGSGSLNCDFDGSANGFTYTTATTFDGLNGSIMEAGAGMSVSARTTYNGGGIDTPQ